MRATPAKAIDHDGVVLHGESPGNQLVQTFGAMGNIEEAAALAAVKVVMMRAGGGFVARRFLGDLNGADRTSGNQPPDRAINSGQSQAGDLYPGQTPGFLGRQGAFSLLKNSQNTLLPGSQSVVFHSVFLSSL